MASRAALGLSQATGLGRRGRPRRGAASAGGLRESIPLRSGVYIIVAAYNDLQGADDKLGQVSRRSLMDVTLCER